LCFIGFKIRENNFSKLKFLIIVTKYNFISITEIAIIL
jgi:hypothetical protein